MTEDQGCVSLPEAAALFAVSKVTLRRRVQQGEVVGAYKAPGKRGPEWRLPLAALAGLGLKPRRSDVATSSSKPVLEDLLRSLLETIQHDRARWDEWDRRLGGAQVEVARLASELRRVQTENRSLRAELESLTLEKAIDLTSEDSDTSAGDSRTA
jgi:phage shock protein A